LNTVQFLKKYAYYYLYVVICVLLFALAISNTATYVNSEQQLKNHMIIVIDPGHGGMDGGTVSCTGVNESKLNLEISLRLNDLMRLLGYETAMTRRTDDSVSTEGNTIREQKRSDLRQRVETVNHYENAFLISVHQNFFTQSQYSGPQVFYADTSTSDHAADLFQQNLNRILAPNSRRTCKNASGIYLMENIQQPGILVECGFLSNPSEEALLRDGEYQKKVCAVLAASAADYVENIHIS